MLSKEAFRSLAGKLRHAKRVLQTNPELAHGLGWAAGVGGLNAGAAQLNKTRMEKGKGSKEFKDYIKSHPSAASPLKAGLIGAAAGGLYGVSHGMGVRADRDFTKTIGGMGRKFRNKGRRSSPNEAPSAKVKDVGTPPWLKGVKTKSEAQQKYRDLAKQHHPDRGGDPEKMKNVNTEWDAFKHHHFNKLSHVLDAFLAELRKIDA